MNEVKGYEFDLTKEPINVILTDYNIEELTPLLEKFDQTVIEKLSNGESIDVRLSLKAKKLINEKKVQF